MATRLITFFPHNPMPPKSGAQLRCVEMLELLMEAGYEITFCSSTAISETPWTREAEEALRAMGVKKVFVHDPKTAPASFGAMVGHQVRRAWRKRLGNKVRLQREIPGLAEWFRGIAVREKAETALVNYVFFSRLGTGLRGLGIRTILETHDLVSLNSQYRRELESRLPAEPVKLAEVPDEVLEEDYFERMSFGVDRQEYRYIDGFDVAIAISQREAGLLRENARRVRTVFLPMTMKPMEVERTLTGGAIYTTGPNPFNVQGYVYLAKRVLPLIKAKAPDFSVDMTGWCTGRVEEVAGIRQLGFVPDLGALYGAARMALCPVFGGTGQQIKIVEAMAYGVPVVALRQASLTSPIRDGENGLVAANPEEFAVAAVRLWNDRELAMRLGQAARETVAKEFSRKAAVETIRREFMGAAGGGK